MESRNPTGSVKDRIAIAMIRDAEQRGELEPGGTVVSATSGNTGIALASACAALGYQVKIVMPESMSRERVALLKMLGADVILSRGGLMGAAVAKAEEVVQSTPGAIRLHQFENPTNPQAHRSTTAEEIWADCKGELDLFLTGVGTGGTVSGIGAFLKDKAPDVEIAAVEPETCAVLSGKAPGPHYIQGIGAGFVPDNFDRNVVDRIVTVSDKLAMSMSVSLARTEGILAGVSSGANLAAICKLAKTRDFTGKTIVTILPDTGERYLSTPMADEALK